MNNLYESYIFQRNRMRKSCLLSCIDDFTILIIYTNLSIQETNYRFTYFNRYCLTRIRDKKYIEKMRDRKYVASIIKYHTWITFSKATFSNEIRWEIHVYFRVLMTFLFYLFVRIYQYKKTHYRLRYLNQYCLTRKCDKNCIEKMRDRKYVASIIKYHTWITYSKLHFLTKYNEKTLFAFVYWWRYYVNYLYEFINTRNTLQVKIFNRYCLTRIRDKNYVEKMRDRKCVASIIKYHTWITYSKLHFLTKYNEKTLFAFVYWWRYYDNYLYEFINTRNTIQVNIFNRYCLTRIRDIINTK